MILKRNFNKNKMMIVIILKIIIKRIKKEKWLIKSRRNITRIKTRRSTRESRNESRIESRRECRRERRNNLITIIISISWKRKK